MLATVGNGEALPTRLPDMNADYPFAPSVGARLRAIGRNADDRRQGLGVPPGAPAGAVCTGGFLGAAPCLLPDSAASKTRRRLLDNAQ